MTTIHSEYRVKKPTGTGRRVGWEPGHQQELTTPKGTAMPLQGSFLDEAPDRPRRLDRFW